MYNEKTRKLTSLMLMTVMVAGGMTFAFPGFTPTANAAANDLYVSAQTVGNFAGIQVIEIVVSDPTRTSTDESEGIPDVELNGSDVLMAQGDDGAWYGYIANEAAILAYTNTAGVDIIDIYGQEKIYDGSLLSGSDAVKVYNATSNFLSGAKSLSIPVGTVDNNPAFDSEDWPFIQSFDFSVGPDVTFTYGKGGTAEIVKLKYDYDDDKDITLDRQKYPSGAYIHISTDDSLLNLSPTADETWVFFTNGTTAYIFEDDTYTTVDYTAIGFEEGPITTSNDLGVYSFVNSTITTVFGESGGNSDGTAVIMKTANIDDNLFVNYDNADKSGLTVNAISGDASIKYNDAHSVVYTTFSGKLAFDGPTIEEWLSGVVIDLQLTDEDRNINSRTDETLAILAGEVPYIEIGSPITISDVHLTNSTDDTLTKDTTTLTATKTMSFTIDEETGNTLNVTVPWKTGYISAIDSGYVFPYVNYDFTAFGGQSSTFFAGNTTGYDSNPINGDAVSGHSDVTVYSNGTHATFLFTIDNVDVGSSVKGQAYFDIFFFGQLGAITDGNGNIADNVKRVNDAIYRFALEETDDNTAKFVGELEYMMINQLNVFDTNTYDDIDAADDTIVIVVNDDMDGADSVTVSYEDINSAKSAKIISVQEAANTHTGIISLDSKSYSAGNTIEVILIDVDLNTDSDTIQTYVVNNSNEWVGNQFSWLSQLKINDKLFDDSCGKGLGLSDTEFTLTETGDATGIFVGSLQLPALYCDGSDDPNQSGTDTNGVATTNGLDLEIEYQDYSDQAGNPTETSVSASVRSNTGSISLDSTVYPVPFGEALHPFYTYGGLGNTNSDTSLGEGPVIITIRVNDPDFNINSNGEDTMSSSHVTMKIARGSNSHTITIPSSEILVETDPKSGIFELDIAITDIVYSGLDPNTGDKQAINQGDILTVTYTDPNDAGGDENTVTDSATFDLRNAVLQTDKPDYIIGSQAIITLIEPDLNLDTDSAETWSLDLINWDSDAGDLNLSDSQFDANPAGLRETGDNTGIFQVVIEIPKDLNGDALERDERITLEYQDNGPAGADYIGDDDEDITIDIRTSNFGASITLDQKVYTWTDKVYVTVVSPDHNFDSNAIDEIGNTKDNEITISTREDELELYKLVETGPDTGIFTGEVILTGFLHDADGDGQEDDTPNITTPKRNGGPTNGQLQANDKDGLSVSFEASDGDVVIGSAMIRWNMGEIQWMEASYPASGSGVIRVIDPDMNWNPESVDSFDITVWSDRSAGGISLSVTETNEQTGIFEGTVYFTTTQASSGSRLNVAEGDTVTARYEDSTVPPTKDNSSTQNELQFTAITNIGTLVPPLERAPAGNLHAVDAFGNSISILSVDKQMQIEADISNNQDRDQKFAYLVQIQDGNGVTVSLAWISGELTPNQRLTSALSWIPLEVGEYTVTGFVWESVSNPTALSPPIKTTLTVR